MERDSRIEEAVERTRTSPAQMVTAGEGEYGTDFEQDKYGFNHTQVQEPSLEDSRGIPVSSSQLCTSPRSAQFSARLGLEAPNGAYPYGTSLHAFLSDIDMAHHSESLHASRRARRIGAMPGGIDLEEVQEMEQHEFEDLGMHPKAAKELHKKARKVQRWKNRPILLEKDLAQAAMQVKSGPKGPLFTGRKLRARPHYYDFSPMKREHTKVMRWHTIQKYLFEGYTAKAGPIQEQVPGEDPSITWKTKVEQRALQRLVQLDRAERSRQLRESGCVVTAPHLYPMIERQLTLDSEYQTVSIQQAREQKRLEQLFEEGDLAKVTAAFITEEPNAEDPEERYSDIEDSHRKISSPTSIDSLRMDLDL